MPPHLNRSIQLCQSESSVCSCGRSCYKGKSQGWHCSAVVLLQAALQEQFGEPLEPTPLPIPGAGGEAQQAGATAAGQDDPVLVPIPLTLPAGL